ncbi:MAG TPA: large conductance mechanosensitive channel protein MscL [Candidatus Saccharimonadales bacterium]|nr:large conductance mechanosensitive channel protein MscL [Candidatus Saccharimonadales bacterium]
MMFKEFRKFILRGNVVDLAVGVVIGAAFNGVVQALVKDMITPIIAAIGGSKHFENSSFTVHNSQFLYGDFLNTLISFLAIAAAVFFFVVQPINKLTELAQRNKDTEEPTTKKCEYCLSVVPVEATRCKFCTSKLEAGKDSD